MVGATLYQADDPVSAASVLADFLAAPDVSADEVRAAGFEPALVDALRNVLSHERTVELACREGAAWVLGRRSVPQGVAWEPVASLPATLQLPAGLRRTTGETIVGLVSEAMRSVRVLAPYVDEAGLGVVAEVAAAATARGVRLEVFQQRWWRRRELEALAHLRRVVEQDGDPTRLAVVQLSQEAPFGHLKVVTADAATAYVGSANITAAALLGRNVELGVLLRGADVVVIERLLELYGTA